jgi:hypothetical protein
MDSDQIYPLLVILGAVLGVIIPYQIIKGAVRNGIIEASAILDRQREAQPEGAVSGGRHGARSGAWISKPPPPN